jgi:predicted permease
MHGPLSALAANLGQRFRYRAEWDKTKAPSITPVREYLLGDVRPGLVATFAAMALIFVIACVNVATLMLGQVGGRATELVVRAAVGAGRNRLVQQLAIEALLLGALAGVAGAGIATAAFRILVRSLPLGELADAVTLDWRLFVATMVVALAAAAAVGLLAASALLRTNLQGTLATTRTGGVSARGGRLEGGLVIAQIALAVLLASGAALLIRSTANLRGIDPGVDLDAIAIVDVTAPTQLNADGRRQAYLAMLPPLQALPTARAVAVTQRLPLRGSGDNWGMDVPGRPEFQDVSTSMRVVTPDYFEVMGIGIRHGRGFGDADMLNTRRLVVINEALAAKFFPGENPIGRMLQTGFDEQGEEIIGVVENVAENDLTEAPAPARYMLYPHVGGGILPVATVALRASSAADVPGLVQAARGVVQRETPQLAVNNTTTMQAVFDQAMGPTRQVVTLVSLLALLALILGAIGVYGVMSHFVSRRIRDYGICITLGLPPSHVLLQVVRRGATMVVIGSLIGALAAVALTGLLSSLLYGVGAADPLALGLAALVLLVIGVGAAIIPARRASLTEPAIVLRQM